MRVGGCEQGEQSGRSDVHLLTGAEEDVHEAPSEGGVQPVLRAEPGERGVGDGLRDEREADGEAGHGVAERVCRGVAAQPAQDGQPPAQLQPQPRGAGPRRALRQHLPRQGHSAAAADAPVDWQSVGAGRLR